MFCHSLGLRGQLDMVGRSTIKQLSSLECGVNDPASTSVLLPMEIKSGKCSPHSLVAHRAQVRILCVTLSQGLSCAFYIRLYSIF